MPPKISRQERLEKKRLAERRRRQRIKDDPVLYALLQEKERQKYLKKKRLGKIIPVSEMSPRQQKIIRKKNRESSNRHNRKKKLKKIEEIEVEEVIYTDDNNSDASVTDKCDPLSSDRSCIDTPPPLRPNRDVSTRTSNRSSNDNPPPPRSKSIFMTSTSNPLSFPSTSHNSNVIARTSTVITRSARRQMLKSSSYSQHDSDISISQLNDTVKRLSPQHLPSRRFIASTPQSPWMSPQHSLSVTSTESTPKSPRLSPQRSQSVTSTESSPQSPRLSPQRSQSVTSIESSPQSPRLSPQRSQSVTSIESFPQSPRLSPQFSPNVTSTESNSRFPRFSPQRSPSATSTKSTPQLPRAFKVTRKQAPSSVKKKSPWKYILRKMKYRKDKELQIKDKKIQELKKINERYKKQITRLKKLNTDLKPVDNKRERTSEPVKESQNLGIEQSKEKLKKDIEMFFEDDENSRLCPGKKEYITKKKVRKQKRYLNFNLQQLHQKFLKEHPEYKISYSFFCTFRPFWTVIPKVNSRDTCMCSVHENMDLAVAALKRNGIITEKSSYDVLKSLCCDARNVNCLNRDCTECKRRHINYLEFDNSQETHYWFWIKSKKKYIKNGKEKVTIQDLKQKVQGHPKDVVEHFEKLLPPYMIHCANIVSQNVYIKNMKSNLKTGECIVHCDFSENYNTKYACEIQSFHFGSSRQQVTLHTSVIYYVQNGVSCTQSFCTLSECLRHDAVAIWQHLMPVLKFIVSKVSEVHSLHFVSDSPTAQYRNRKMFYVMAKLHWEISSLRTVTWNYTEKGHGKGAPDGIGGVLKRTADRIVAEGNDIPNMEVLITHLKDRCPGVILEEVRESGIFEKEMLIPSDLKEFRGTMGIHQVIWNRSKPEVLAMRRLSCNMGVCSISEECPHGQHVGFFEIGSTSCESSKAISRRKSFPTKKNKPKKRTHKSQPNTGHTNLVQEKEEEINVPSDDSFWTQISMNEEMITTSITKAVLSTLHTNVDSGEPSTLHTIVDSGEPSTLHTIVDSGEPSTLHTIVDSDESDYEIFSSKKRKYWAD